MITEEKDKEYLDKLFVYFNEEVKDGERIKISDMTNKPNRFIEAINHLIKAEWLNDRHARNANVTISEDNLYVTKNK